MGVVLGAVLAGVGVLADAVGLATTSNALFAVAMLVVVVTGSAWAVSEAVFTAKAVHNTASLVVAGVIWFTAPAYFLLARWAFGWWDPPIGFYDAAAQVSAAFLIALALTLRLEAADSSGSRQQLAGAILGFAASVAMSLLGSLIALARDDGSTLIFTLTAGGIVTATVLMVLVAVARTRTETEE